GVVTLGSDGSTIFNTTVDINPLPVTVGSTDAVRFHVQSQTGVTGGKQTLDTLRIKSNLIFGTQVQPIYFSAANNYAMAINHVELDQSVTFVAAGATTFTTNAPALLPTPAKVTLGDITEVGGSWSVAIAYNPNVAASGVLATYAYNGTGEVIFNGSGSTYSG